MAGVVPPPLLVPESEETRFITQSDLTSSGRLGASALVVTDQQAHRFEKSLLGEEMASSYELSKLANPRIETLVDASALVADFDGKPIELLRVTAKRGLILAGAEKKLKALLEGAEIPEVGDGTRLCPKCSSDLPEDSDVCLGCISKGRTLLRLFEYTKPYKARLLLGTVLTFGGAIIDLLPPFLAATLVDRGFIRREVTLFPWLIGALIVARIAGGPIQIARGRNVAWLSSKIAVAIRQSLFNKLQQLSLSFYDKRNVGSIMSRMTNDTTSLYDVLVDGIPIILNQGALIIGIPTAMLIMNWQVAIWPLLPR